LFDTVSDPFHVILSPLASTSHNGVASRRGGLVAGGIFVPSSLCCRWTGQFANTSQVLGCCEDQHQTHSSPRLFQAGVQPGIQLLKTVSKRMPSVNHPHLHHRAASNEPDARRCAVCGFTTAAKSKDGFVMVKRVGEDACHGPYLIVFGHASVLKGCVVDACQRAGLAPLAHRDCVRMHQKQQPPPPSPPHLTLTLTLTLTIDATTSPATTSHSVVLRYMGNVARVLQHLSWSDRAAVISLLQKQGIIEQPTVLSSHILGAMVLERMKILNKTGTCGKAGGQRLSDLQAKANLARLVPPEVKEQRRVTAFAEASGMDRAAVAQAASENATALTTDPTGRLLYFTERFDHRGNPGISQAQFDGVRQAWHDYTKPSPSVKDLCQLSEPMPMPMLLSQCPCC
ncbi:hypothetical protein QJQ45_016483, partial [Haematococcus lacustris]